MRRGKGRRPWRQSHRQRGVPFQKVWSVRWSYGASGAARSQGVAGSAVGIPPQGGRICRSYRNICPCRQARGGSSSPGPQAGVRSLPERLFEGRTRGAERGFEIPPNPAISRGGAMAPALLHRTHDGRVRRPGGYGDSSDQRLVGRLMRGSKCLVWTLLILVAAVQPRAALASGLFGSLEAGYHRIVPVDTTLDTALDGHRGSPTWGVRAGYEFDPGVFLAVDASHIGFDPKYRLSGGRFYGEVPSRVRTIPILGSVGFRRSLARRLSGWLTIGAGAARETQESDLEPRLWNRTNWRFTYRFTLGTESKLGGVGVGAQFAWLFLPAVRTPQLSAIDFGGMSVAATLSFGRRQ